MKKLLIVRSVSFQQLDSIMAVVAEKFPQHSISILTHEHGVALCKKYTGVEEVFAYEHKGGFSVLNPASVLKGRLFDAVVIPVSNMSGKGFGNVILFALTIRGRRRYVWNLVSEVRRVTKVRIIWDFLGGWVFRLIAGLLTFVIGVFLLVLAAVKMLCRKVNPYG